jgi:hypothetical protein
LASYLATLKTRSNDVALWFILALIGVSVGYRLEDADPVYLLVFALLIVGIAPWVIELRNHSFDVFESKNVFVFLYLIEYAVSAVFVHSRGIVFFNTDLLYDSRLVAQCVALAIVGLLAFYVGYYATFSNQLASCLPRFGRSVNEGRAKAVMFVLALFGMSGAVALFSTGGGFWYVLSNINEVRLERSFGLTHVRYLLILLNLLVLIMLLGTPADRQGARPSLLFAIVAVVFVQITVGHRLWAVFVILSALIVRHYLYRRASIGKALLALGAIIVLNVSYVAYRDARALDDAGISFQLSLDSGLFYLWHTFLSRYHGVESLALVSEGVKSGIDFNFGLAFLKDLVLIPVPLALWPDRPDVTSIAFSKEFLGYALSEEGKGGGIAITVLGDLYWAGGVVAIVLGMMLLGVIHKAFYTNLRKNFHGANVVFYSLAYGFLAQMIEGLSVYTVMLLSAALPLFISLRFITSEPAEVLPHQVPKKNLDSRTNG